MKILIVLLLISFGFTPLVTKAENECCHLVQYPGGPRMHCCTEKVIPQCCK
jgi:hypothetical protein